VGLYPILNLVFKIAPLNIPIHAAQPWRQVMSAMLTLLVQFTGDEWQATMREVFLPFESNASYFLLSMKYRIQICVSSRKKMKGN
jgi:hypothetical protein